MDVRLPGNGNSNSHGARPVHSIISMIKWIWTSRLSIKNSFTLSLGFQEVPPWTSCPPSQTPKKRYVYSPVECGAQFGVDASGCTVVDGATHVDQCVLLAGAGGCRV
jgi:hypothetical protein